MQSAIPEGWFHLVLNYNNTNYGDEMTVYLDGVLAQTYTLRFGGTASVKGGKAVIGRCLANYDGGHASVVVDEMTFWNRNLSPQEIQAMYNMHQ